MTEVSTSKRKANEKRVNSMKKLQTIYISSENTILVIVDMQNKSCNPASPGYSKVRARHMPTVISSIHKLTEQARNTRIPVIYIQSVRTQKEAEFTVFGRDSRLVIGTWDVEIIDELKPQEGDIVIQKFSHDPFYKTNLDQALERLVPDPTQCYAIVTGGNSNVCLYHAVMGFFLRDYWCIVPVDSIFYPNEAGNQRALEQFSQGYVNVFLSRSDFIKVAKTQKEAHQRPVPGT